MTKTYSIIGPDVFMDEQGMLYKKANDTYTPIRSKYIEAEDRYVQRNLEKKGWDSQCRKAF